MKLCKILLFIAAISSSGFSQNQLATIKNFPRSEKNNYKILRELETESIAILSENDQSELKKRNIDLKVIESNYDTSAVYLLIGKCSEDDLTLSNYGTILHSFDYCKLLKTHEYQIVHIQKLKLFFERLIVPETPCKQLQQDGNRKFEINLNNKDKIDKILEDISIDSLRSYVSQLQNYDTRKSTTTTNKTTVCNDLKDKLSLYCDSVYLEPFSSSYGPNIVGIKKGSVDPSLTKYCVIGAHMDAVSSGGPFKAAGADDNASGSAAVIECARVLKNYKFSNTIRFVLFNAEEDGLYGSAGFAQNMNNANHELIGGAITMDMIAHSSKTENTILLEGTTTLTNSEKFVREYARDIVTTYTDMNIKYNLQGFGSDHVSFWKHDYVSILLIEQDWNSNSSYHKDWDTLDCPQGLNDDRLFKNITKTAIASVCDLATPIDPVTITTNNNIKPNNHKIKSIIKTNNSVLFNSTINGILSIYNMQGVKIAQLKPHKNSTNTYDFIWNFKKRQHGTYLVRFKNNDSKITTKIVL